MGSYAAECGTPTPSSICCPSGFTCAGGAAAPVPCVCAPGSACPFGAVPGAACGACPVFFFCGGGSSQQTRCTTPGYWCPPGAVRPDANACAPGTYGTVLGAMSEYRSPLCDSCNSTYYGGVGYTRLQAGFYCPAATPGVDLNYEVCRSTNGGPMTCDFPRMVAPEIELTWCPRGFYCLGGDSQPLPAACLPGSAATAYSQDESVCPQCNAGTLCAGGSSQPVDCPAAPGAFCPANYDDVAAAGGVPCPVSFYCTGGTAAPEVCACPVGNYCAVGSATASGSACVVGSYCVGGVSAPSEYLSQRRGRAHFPFLVCPPWERLVLISRACVGGVISGADWVSRRCLLVCSRELLRRGVNELLGHALHDRVLLQVSVRARSAGVFGRAAQRVRK